jgi:Protein of unknown function (DUF2793)
MPSTPHLNLPLIAANQSQKHVTFNDALFALDATIQISVLSATTATPPSTPADGARYLIPANATGAWTGQTDHIAVATAGSWQFSAPERGWIIHITDQQRLICRNASSWLEVLTAQAGGSTLSLPKPITINGNGNGLDPAIHVERDDGLHQADMTATTYGVGGGGILHGRFARGTKSAPLPALAGDIIAGIGGRAWQSGGSFQSSSPTSIHWVVSENQTATGFGSYLRVLTTPKGSVNRQERLVVADNGTVWAHDTGVYDPKQETQTKPFADVRFLASGSNDSGSGNTSIAAVGYGATTVGFRGGIAAGTAATPAATPTGAVICYLGGHGFDGTQWTAGSKAIIMMRASENWSSTAQGASIAFEVTQNGQTTRTERMRIADNGNIGIGTTAPSTRLHVSGPARVGSYTITTLPSASSSGAGAIIYVSNDTAGATLAFSDGTIWRRVHDRTQVA